MAEQPSLTAAKGPNPSVLSRVPTAGGQQASSAPAAQERAGEERADGPPRAEAKKEESDEELFLKGDRESLAELVGRYQAGLFALLVQLTKGDVHLADDLFQEAFLRAVRAAKTFDPSRSFRAWISAIALNLVRDELRRRKLRGETPLAEDNPDEREGPRHLEEPGSGAERREETRRITAALARLTEKEREIVLLHFYQGLTLVEAAEALEIPLGTAKSRLHSALTRLKELLRA